MARASYIYILTSKTKSHYPIGAFTVKHELLTWLDENPDYNQMVIRVPDGKVDKLASQRADKLRETGEFPK